LWLCETIYPSDDGSSAIPPEKLQKAIAKGVIPAPTAQDEEDLDEDLDAKIDSAIREVCFFYFSLFFFFFFAIFAGKKEKKEHMRCANVSSCFIGVVIL
jgi:hypothetical protein